MPVAEQRLEQLPHRGDIAIATSVFEGDLTRNEKQIRFRGKNLIVWKKQGDSSWKIFRYMYDEIPAKK